MYKILYALAQQVKERGGVLSPLQEAALIAGVCNGTLALSAPTGIATHAPDIHIVYLHGDGFALHRVEPMLCAGAVSLPNVLRTLHTFVTEPGQMLRGSRLCCR